MNTNLTRDQLHARTMEFPAPIRNLAAQNPAIHSVIEHYAIGDIVTREEALYQMILRLAATAETAQKQLIIHTIKMSDVIPGWQG